MQPRVLISPMNINTAGAVSLLEKECFSTPWGLDGILAELSNPLAVFYTAGVEGETAGYAGMHCVVDTGYIANIAVGEKFRRMGVAEALMQKLLEYGRENGLATLTLEVRPSNTAALALYRKFGFIEEGRRRNFYRVPPEDALILTMHL